MRIGSLFTGYGGLDIAVEKHFGGEVAWYSEIDKAACTVLQAHHPMIPNLGDVTKIDWSMVEPVDILTGGYPCQPFSMAGDRKGKDDERHLWPYVRGAVGALRPSHVVLENVLGHLSLGLANVIGDLAGLGYDCRWGVVRASDAGACHERSRVFITANPYGVSHRSRDGKQLEDSDAGFDVLRSVVSDPQSRFSRSGDEIQEANDTGVDWSGFAAAIRRWERLTRPAPEPTIAGVDGERLSPAFVEWMMGLPEGHVTGHGLSNAQALKMLGNGVVWQQALRALGLLCPHD
jgi:DNA (cytosine-5)-methyltransferase 1